jgi:hypothetical protein
VSDRGERPNGSISAIARQGWCERQDRAGLYAHPNKLTEGLHYGQIFGLPDGFASVHFRGVLVGFRRRENYRPWARIGANLAGFQTLRAPTKPPLMSCTRQPVPARIDPAACRSNAPETDGEGQGSFRLLPRFLLMDRNLILDHLAQAAGCGKRMRLARLPTRMPAPFLEPWQAAGRPSKPPRPTNPLPRRTPPCRRVSSWSMNEVCFKQSLDGVAHRRTEFQ